jgi:endonuclease/exonuclease/phosphatase family metal-dependent hydrolase
MALRLLLRGIRALGLLLSLLAFTFTFAQDAASDRPQEPVELRVMTFNIWLGGEMVDFGGVVEAVRVAEADIVGLQEATGNAPRLAEALGWQHVSTRMQIISRFPLIDPPGGDGHYLYVQVRPGQVVALANVHLTSDPYGPYAVRDGATLDEVLQIEADTRMPGIQPVLDAVAPLIEAGTPVLLTGDFNTPSHRDWTAQVAEARPEIAYPVEWPVTLAVEAAGFVDTYRAIHSDPVARPGITWTYGYPYPRLRANEVIDRIDMVYAAGPVEVLDSQIVGDAGTPDLDFGLTPYPSDHRAVVSTVRVTPVVPPVFVAVQERVIRQGEPVVVQYHAPSGEDETGAARDRILIVRAETARQAETLDAPLMWLPPQEAGPFGTVTFSSETLRAGEFTAVLVDAEGVARSRSRFSVIAAENRPSVSTSEGHYWQGDPITVKWGNAPGYRWDWVAIYSLGDPDLYNGYWAYAYTGATASGDVTFDADLLGEEMLPPGEYEVRLMLDDGYQVLASDPFSVYDDEE